MRRTWKMLTKALGNISQVLSHFPDMDYCSIQCASIMIGTCWLKKRILFSSTAMHVWDAILDFNGITQRSLYIYISIERRYESLKRSTKEHRGRRYESLYLLFLYYLESHVKVSTWFSSHIYFVLYIYTLYCR